MKRIAISFLSLFFAFSALTALACGEHKAQASADAMKVETVANTAGGDACGASKTVADKGADCCTKGQNSGVAMVAVSAAGVSGSSCSAQGGCPTASMALASLVALGFIFGMVKVGSKL